MNLAAPMIRPRTSSAARSWNKVARPTPTKDQGDLGAGLAGDDEGRRLQPGALGQRQECGPQRQEELAGNDQLAQSQG